MCYCMGCASVGETNPRALASGISSHRDATTYNYLLIAPQLEKEGKDQESRQSSTTPDPGYQWESDNYTIRHHKREPRGQQSPRHKYTDSHESISKTRQK